MNNNEAACMASEGARDFHPRWGKMVERERVVKQLKPYERRYRQLIEAGGDGVLVIDPATLKITDASDLATDLLGRAKEELLGKEFWEIGLLEDREANIRFFQKLRDKQLLRCDHLPVKTREGKSFVAQLICAFYRADDREVIQCHLRDITLQTTAERTSSHLAAIVESSEDVILSRSLEGVILSWNQAAEKLFGYSAEEIIGKSIYVLIPSDRMGEEEGILARLRRGERVDQYETVRMAKNGRSIAVALAVSLIRNGSGRIIGASQIARDITKQKLAEAERDFLLAQEQAARCEAEAANRAKDEFLAVLSHNLRTPLNVILGWSSLLSLNKPDENLLGAALETIQRNAKLQAKLIDDLLDASQIIDGKIYLDMQPVELTEVVAGAMDEVRPAVKAKEISLRAELDQMAGTVLGDPARLQQIIRNLLSNAVKFTPRLGSIRIRLERIDAQISISVSDTGSGIKPENLPYVFERFRQADIILAGIHGGVGLAVVRRLVELHEGRVYANSRGEGKGATFTVELPIFAYKETEQNSVAQPAVGRVKRIQQT